ncbi:abortive infection family protein [Janibacter sp. RAF52]|uniref:abortive infection family protein n=1 Tax=unclassified Janibacter TaxID=2649294 RepID=UPI003F909C27
MTLSKKQVMQVVSRYIGVEGGYLGDFSYRTHTEFYPEYCDIDDIFPDELAGTTRERFIEILSTQSADRQARILRGVLERFPVDSRPEARSKFKPQIEAWIAELHGEPAVANPKVEAVSTSDVVRRALSDAESLLRTGGPVSAVDRIHTALHGHVKALCAASGIQLADSVTLQKAMKELRTHHPKLKPTGARATDVSQVLFSMAATLDALNTIRNNASAAHPNDDLLGDPEGLLALNAGRTIFTYVVQKTSESDPEPAVPTGPLDVPPF